MSYKSVIILFDEKVSLYLILKCDQQARERVREMYSYANFSTWLGTTVGGMGLISRINPQPSDSIFVAITIGKRKVIGMLYIKVGLCQWYICETICWITTA